MVLRRGARWVVIGTLLALWGCDAPGTHFSDGVPSGARAPLPPPPAALTPGFLVRATGALAGYLKPESALLEIRASGSVFSVQLQNQPPRRDIVQVDYVEFTRHGLRESRIYGPNIVPQLGQGKIEQNLFSFADINLPQMAKAFPVAKLAVDPESGEIEQLIVRRFLPFSTRVRARIFVRSPRIPGSIDTNEDGTPLK